MKTDLKTWASRKRKGHVISPEGEKPGTAVGTCPPEKKHVTPQEVRLKYAFRELPSPGPRVSPANASTHNTGRMNIPFGENPPPLS